MSPKNIRLKVFKMKFFEIVDRKVRKIDKYLWEHN